MEEKKHPLIKHVDEKTIHVLENAIVPENNVFNVYDHKGALIKRINSGGLNDLSPMDCFLIDCPSTFPPEPGAGDVSYKNPQNLLIRISDASVRVFASRK